MVKPDTEGDKVDNARERSIDAKDNLPVDGAVVSMP